jgi:hypothetical protein
MEYSIIPRRLWQQNTPGMLLQVGSKMPLFVCVHAFELGDEPWRHIWQLDAPRARAECRRLLRHQLEMSTDVIDSCKWASNEQSILILSPTKSKHVASRPSSVVIRGTCCGIWWWYTLPFTTETLRWRFVSSLWRYGIAQAHVKKKCIRAKYRTITSWTENYLSNVIE